MLKIEPNEEKKTYFSIKYWIKKLNLEKKD